MGLLMIYGGVFTGNWFNNDGYIYGGIFTGNGFNSTDPSNVVGGFWLAKGRIILDDVQVVGKYANPHPRNQQQGFYNLIGGFPGFEGGVFSSQNLEAEMPCYYI